MLIKTFAAAVHGIEAAKKAGRFEFLSKKVEVNKALGETLETTKIHSVAGKIGKETSLMNIRPFRSPHHTISDAIVLFCVVNSFILKITTGIVFQTTFYSVL